MQMFFLKILQVILVISVLVLVHETGHFFFAKLFGIRVDKFYLFFDIKGYRLFSTKHSRLIGTLLPKLKNSETDYGIGWLPLGGYCKINGMTDSFRTRPVWQRLLVLSGGVLFNLMFAAIIYACLLGIGGKTYLSTEDNCIIADELASEMGFQTGDRILTIDDYHPEFFEALRGDIIRRVPCFVTVLRDKDTVGIKIEKARIQELIQSPNMFQPINPVFRKDEFDFIGAVCSGCRMTISTVGDCLRDIKLFLTPSTEVYKSVGSFVAIGQALPSAWNWRMLFIVMGMLSVVLFVMNLLPIPPLDGGLILLTLIELVTGRELNKKIRIIVQLVGMSLLLILFCLALFNDIIRLVAL